MPKLETRRPFTRAQGIAAGISPGDLRSQRFRRILHRVYILARVPDHPVVRAEAALIVHPPAAFASHTSAARVLGIPVPADTEEHVTVLDKSDRSRITGIRCHVAGPGPDDVWLVSGLRVSSPARLFVELASLFDLVDLVVAGDALVRQKRITAEALRAACEHSTDRFATLARRAAAYVRQGADSAMESRLRMLIVLAGLPEPEVNHKLRDEHGAVRRRLDLSYPSVRLIVEYDGRQHAETTRQWNTDLERREEFDEEEWRIIVVTSEGIYRTPAPPSKGCTGPSGSAGTAAFRDRSRTSGAGSSPAGADPPGRPTATAAARSPCGSGSPRARPRSCR